MRSKSFFESLDSELFLKQTFWDILYWIVLILIGVNILSSGSLFLNLFNNFGYTVDLGYFVMNGVLFAYCVTMVFAESKAAKNVITAIGFFSMLYVLTGISNTTGSIGVALTSGVDVAMNSLKAPEANVGFKYGANVAQPERPSIVPTPKTDPNALKWMRIGNTQYLNRGNPLNKEGRDWCKTNLNTNNQSRLHCYTGYMWSKNEWSVGNDTH
ncbi:hypothetical protein N9043_00385 [bacterium]|nr:hypothetical protein [bacterium]